MVNQRPFLFCALAAGVLLSSYTTVYAFTRTVLLSRSGVATTSTNTLLFGNAYDDWRESGVCDTLFLDDDNARQCLDELIESDYGKTMFGMHDLPAAHGITGMLEYVESVGPEVILSLSGAYWHKRATVLGRAAIYLNARIPEVTQVNVEDPSELEDFEDVYDEDTGEFMGQRDKRAPDFNGDRATMEYQGIDPDQRGPFPLGPGGSMIIPA